MSDRYFPTLPGVVQVGRAPFFVNAAKSSDNGRRIVVKKRSAAGFRYTLEVRFLRTMLGEDTTLFDFFAAHSGSAESFLYVDAKDGIARRVQFIADDLGLKWENGGVYSGEVELETVVF